MMNWVSGEITYLLGGREICPSTGTPHIQGYLELKTKRTLAGLKTLLSCQRVNLQISRGTSEQNKEYCFKDGNILWELGNPMRQGKRSDLDDCLDDVRDGMSLRELWINHTSVMVRCEQGIKRAMTMLKAPEIRSTFMLSSFRWDFDQDYSKSVIFWGNAGIGKTSYALALMPSALVVSHIDDLLDFDPTVNEGIIFDDMDFKHMPRTAQIHIVDNDLERSIHCRYQRAKIPAKTKKIFTTNEFDGRVVLTDDPAIKRRVRIIKLN